MQVTLQDRERLNPIGKGLEDIMDALVASVQGGWDIEHLHNGGHGSIHAQSVYSLEGYTERGRTIPMGDPIPYTPTLSGVFSNDPIGTMTCWWSLIGSTMVISLIVESFSVPVAGFLGFVSLPPGFGGARYEAFNACLINDNGTEARGVCVCRVNEPYLRVRPLLGNLWGVSVNNSSFYLTITASVVPLHV